MQKQDIRRIMQMMAEHGIVEFSYSDPDSAVDLAIGLPLHPQITCPQAGIFLHRHPGGTEDLPRRRKVGKGEIVAYLKVGAVLVPVSAEEDGWLPEPFPADGDVVGYGDLLF